MADERDRSEAAAAGEARPGAEAARVELRQAAYCVVCDRIVERAADGSCSAGPHTAEALSGRILLGDDEPLPRLPRFNLAAFLLPFVWGPVHGMYAGFFLLPIWVFALDAVEAARDKGGWLWAPAAAVVAATLAFQVFFARRANGAVFRRVCDRVPLERFAARQRAWAVGSVVACVLAVGAALLAGARG